MMKQPIISRINHVLESLYSVNPSDPCVRAPSVGSHHLVRTLAASVSPTGLEALDVWNASVEESAGELWTTINQVETFQHVLCHHSSTRCRLSVTSSSTWTTLRLENLLFDALFCPPRIEGWWTAGEATIIPSCFTGYSSLSWKESYCVPLFFSLKFCPLPFPWCAFVQFKFIKLFNYDQQHTKLMVFVQPRASKTPPHLLFLIKMKGGMVVMFRPPTTTQHCQPIFAASTDCVSIADRRSVCVMCTQLHSCWRTLDGWRFQWLRWLAVPVGGQDWELFAVCGCVHARRRVIFVSVPFDLRPAFPRVCSTLIIKALSAVKWGHGCVRVRMVLPLFTGNFASSLVTGLTRNSGGCLTHWIWLPV